MKTSWTPCCELGCNDVVCPRALQSIIHVVMSQALRGFTSVCTFSEGCAMSSIVVCIGRNRGTCCGEMSHQLNIAYVQLYVNYGQLTWKAVAPGRCLVMLSVYIFCVMSQALRGFTSVCTFAEGCAMSHWEGDISMRWWSHLGHPVVN